MSTFDARAAYEVSIGPLGKLVLLRVTFISASGSRGRKATLKLKRIEDLPNHTRELAEAMLQARQEDPAEVVLLESVDQRPPRRTFFGFGLVGYMLANEARSAGAGAVLRIETQGVSFAVAGEARLVSVRYRDLEGVAASVGFGLRWFLAKSETQPFLGGGLNMLFVPADDTLSLLPTCPYLELGVELMRRQSSHIDFALRAELPAFIVVAVDDPFISIIASYSFDVT